MNFKNKQEYLDARQKMLDEASKLINEGKIDEGNKKMEDIKNMDEAFEAMAIAQANLNALNNNRPNALADSAIGGALTPETMSNGANGTDIYDSVEYRTAFMNNVLHGTKIPSKFVNADANTKTTDVAAVIPTTTLNKIIEKMEKVGTIWNKVTRTYYKGGVAVPTSTAKPVATWVAEGAGSDRQKKSTGSITFAYYKLRCEISMSLETSVVTLPIFESTFINNVAEAMIKAIETAIFTGTGSTGKQPKGFLTETVVSGQDIEIAKTAGFTYKKLCDAEAALPEEYETDAEWYMRKATFFGQIASMTDQNGQPVARVNVGLNGKPEYTILGRPVNFVNQIAAYADAPTADTIVACIYNLKDYLVNTNLDMYVKQFEDNDTDDQVTKAIMLVDGKAVDINSLVTITKKSA